MEKIVLIGGGGHCKSVIDSIRSTNYFEIVGITDYNVNVEEVVGIKVLGKDDILEEVYKSGIENAFITIGSIGDTKLRRNIYKNLKKIGFKIPNIIDKTAIVSEKAKLGEGIFVGKGSIINVEVEIGNNAIINTGSIIEHECKIGDFVHVAPGVTMSGNVVIGDDVHIGTGTSIIQGINISNNAIIGAGSLIIRNVDSYSKVYGNPGRKVN